MMNQINTDDDKCHNFGVMHQGSCMVHDKQTYLLLVNNIEICAGRFGEVSSMMNNMHNACFIQLASSICDSLHHKKLLSQVNILIQLCSYPLIHDISIIASFDYNLNVIQSNLVSFTFLDTT
jgi:hypothetical protein